MGAALRKTGVTILYSHRGLYSPVSKFLNYFTDFLISKNWPLVFALFDQFLDVRLKKF